MAVQIRKILFIDAAHPILQQELEKQGFICDYFPTHARKDFEAIIPQYTGIIIRSKIKLDAEILERADNLLFIGRIGAGMENIDAVYAASHGIVCLNAPEGNRDAVGEHTLGMLLMLLNNLRRADMQVRQGIWLRTENRGIEIMGKTIGIIGYGNMGGAFAKRLSGFGATVLAYDKYKTNYSDQFVTESSLEELFAETDILSLHVPLTQETHHMVNQAFIKKFKKSFYLINTARGQVVHTAKLVKALKCGQILGAALDVLECENFSFGNLNKNNLPADFQYLKDMDNVVLSPHIAGWTYESEEKMAWILAEKIKMLMYSKPLDY